VGVVVGVAVGNVVGGKGVRVGVGEGAAVGVGEGAMVGVGGLAVGAAVTVGVGVDAATVGDGSAGGGLGTIAHPPARARSTNSPRVAFSARCTLCLGLLGWQAVKHRRSTVRQRPLPRVGLGSLRVELPRALLDGLVTVDRRHVYFHLRMPGVLQPVLRHRLALLRLFVLNLPVGPLC